MKSIFDPIKTPKHRHGLFARQHLYIEDPENPRFIVNVPSLDKIDALQLKIFVASIPFYILFRSGRIWSQGHMNHVLFFALSFYASRGWASLFYMNPRFEAARKNNLKEEQHQRVVNAKHYNRSLNAACLKFLQYEGLGYLSDDFIDTNPEVKEFIKRYPQGLQRRAVMKNYQMRDSIVIPTAQEEQAGGQDEAAEEEEEEE